MVTIDDVTIVEAGKLTMSDANYASYCYPYNLDFSGVTGLTAYTAKSNGMAVELTAVTGGKVPGGAGVVLSGEAGDYYVPTTTEAVGALADNELVGITEATNVAADGGNGYTNYILSNETAGVGFYKAAAAGATLRANRAYLHTMNGNASRFMAMDGIHEAGINDATRLNDNGHSVYNLSGQQVKKPTKGLFIVDGKKVMMK